MAEQWEQNYLESICEAMEGNAYDAFIEDIGGAPAIIIDYGDNSDGLPKTMKLSIEHIVQNTCQFQIMAELFSNIDDKSFSDIEKVTAHINQFLTVGNATIFFGNRSMFYNYAFLFTKEMTTDTVTLLLASAMDIILITAKKIIEILTPLIEGRTTAQALIEGNISILQGG